MRLATPLPVTAIPAIVSLGRGMPLSARVLQVGWLIVQTAVLGFAVAATPGSQAAYRTTCPGQYCTPFLQANTESVQLLDRLGISLPAYATAMVAVEWLFLLLMVSVSAAIVWKQPRDPVGMLLAYFLAVVGGQPFLFALSQQHPDLAVLFQICVFVKFAVALPVFMRFPDGQWVPTWSRWLALAVPPLAAVIAFSDEGVLGRLALIVHVVLWMFVVCTLVYRYRHVSDSIARQQTKWLILAGGFFVLTLVLGSVASLLNLAERYQLPIVMLIYIAQSAVMIAMGFAILRYRLFDIDLVLSRGLVYGSLTAAVVGVYVAIVSLLGTLLRSDDSVDHRRYLRRRVAVTVRRDCSPDRQRPVRSGGNWNCTPGADAHPAHLPG
jgi:hypothetical protein